MTFQEALNEVITNDVIVWRKTHQFADDYDRPRDQGKPRPWSEWTRVWLDDDTVDYDAIIYFETNNRDDINGTWFLTWSYTELTKADILATDWEITTRAQCINEE